ncbi:putative Eburicol 14-alpha-demethylase [Macrophomina phaseolina]|uniref:Eburicol 14-alpha-demethylase n=1 Tax=Macrophomina phaseolina TaxID=35725 RepID=A0ABQ8FU39_9PEZI|nr:putative Eburicol 14-alpha-demethylase [Macrophomina phaseolina]
MPIYGNSSSSVESRLPISHFPTLLFYHTAKFCRDALTGSALRGYVQLICREVEDYTDRLFSSEGSSGEFEVLNTMANIMLLSAARTMQGEETRRNLDTGFAKLYHDLDEAFIPINFVFPWLPLPRNRRRDLARKKIVEIFKGIIEARRAGKVQKGSSEDIVWTLMDSKYKGGSPVPDEQIAGMMIALLMAGHHNTATISSWAIIHLTHKPALAEEIYQEQCSIFGSPPKLLTMELIQRLSLHGKVIDETIRMHSPLHSVMRKVKSPLTIGAPDSGVYTIPPGHTLLASPIWAAREAEFCEDPLEWDPHRWDDGEFIFTASETSSRETYSPSAPSSFFLPFGAGRHRCTGEKFARLQLVTVLAALVRDFKFGKRNDEDVLPETDYSSMFSMAKGPVFRTWERRVKNR